MRIPLASVIAMSCSGSALPVRTPTPPPAPAPVVHHLQDPDLNRPAPKKLLAIDWATTRVTSDAEALALWQRIAPTGDDWEEKLAEIPTDGEVATALAIALLHEGNFACAAPASPNTCGHPPSPDVPAPAPTATLTDPCLRRMLALWAITQLAHDELPLVQDALRAIAAIPPPESQLVATAIRALPESDYDGRYDLLAIAWRAGQRDLVNGMMTSLDAPHLEQAATQLHIDGALEPLAGALHRATFLAAVVDGQLAPRGRIAAMQELVELADESQPTGNKGPAKLPADVRKALIAAGKATDCSVAAAAARALDQHGDRALVPKLPRTRAPDAIMRGLCVLVSFERMQRSDEPSYFQTYLPARGLELVQVTFDPYSDTDPDGDGNVHTEHHRQIMKLDEAVLPEIEDLENAFHHCQGTVCRSDDREFRFTFQPGGGGLLLSKLEVAELPPCR